MITNRKPRSRGGSAKKKGINDEHIAVVVTQDRNKEIDLTVATKGRLKKIDIDQAIGQMITDQTVLCSESIKNKKQCRQHVFFHDFYYLLFT